MIRVLFDENMPRKLRREISERAVSTQKAWWGYDVIRIADPDGNELLFPLDETNDRERQR